MYYIERIGLERERIGDFTRYPFSVPAVSGLTEIEVRAPVTFLAGENGMGKSTLLEALAVLGGFNPEGGTRNFSFSTYDSHSPLSEYMTLAKSFHRPQDGFFLRAESFYNVASEIERLDDIPSWQPPIKDSYGGSLHEMSHGESFFSLMNNRFGGRGLYFLDEPEAALSPMRQMSMLTILDDLVRRDSQFFIATHSPIIMAYPKAEIWLIGEEGIRRTPYRETEHYQLTKAFLDAPESFLRQLL